jgi:hypothetical protein
MTLNVNSFVTYENRDQSYFFKTADLGDPTVSFIIRGNGSVGIGTINPTTKLDVVGTIRAREVKVCLNQGCDYVF